MSAPPASPAPRQSKLEIAAGNGDKDEVALLYKGALPQERARAFYNAISNQRLPVVELMIDSGIRADLGIQDQAIYTAALSMRFAGPGSRHMELVKLLCSRGFDPNTENFLMETALQHVLQPSSPYSSDLVFALIDCGADPLAPRKEQSYRDGKVYGTFSIPTLHDAVAHDDLKLVAFLLDKGVDINVREDEFGHTAFFHAQPSVEMVRLLLRKGADPNAVDTTGMSVLTHISCASETPSTEAIKVLISAGAKLKGLYGGRSALLCAAQTGSAELVEMLLSLGADPNLKDDDGRTVLENFVDRERHWTPYPVAPEVRAANRLRIVRALLDFGADPELFEPRLSHYAWKDDGIGKALGNALEQFYLKRVRKCIANLPAESVYHGQPSEKPIPPDGDRFSHARVERISALAQFPVEASISPDGRWLASLSRKRVIIYDLMAGRLHEPIPIANGVEVGFRGALSELTWAQDSRLMVVSGQMAVDLASGGPRVVPGAVTASAKTEGARLCGFRNDKGHLTGYLGGPEMKHRISALGRPVRYEFRHDPGSVGHAVMIDGDREVCLVGHEEGWVRKHIKAWLKENGRAIGYSWLFPTPKEWLEMRFKGRLSPNDRYLYYEISAAGIGWGSPPDIRRHFVMDLQTEGDVWEIAEPVLSSLWHPNGRQLLLWLGGSGVGGQVAVVSFP